MTVGMRMVGALPHGGGGPKLSLGPAVRTGTADA